MPTVWTTLEVMTADVILAIWGMDSPVMISMNAMRPIQHITVMFLPTVTTQREALCVHATLDTPGMELAAVSMCSLTLYLYCCKQFKEGIKACTMH